MSGRAFNQVRRKPYFLSVEGGEKRLKSCIRLAEGSGPVAREIRASTRRDQSARTVQAFPALWSFKEDQRGINQRNICCAQSLCKFAGMDVVSCSAIFDQGVENKARVDDDFGREWVVGEEMPIRRQRNRTLSLGGFDDLVQSSFLDEFDFRQGAEIVSALRNGFAVAFRRLSAGLGTPDIRSFSVSAMSHSIESISAVVDRWIG
jgi:hypothetical protein